MQYQIQLTANQRPETLERILRVIRHRGFELVNLQFSQQNGSLALNASVQSEREISLLVTQLAKLEDVQQVTTL